MAIRWFLVICVFVNGLNFNLHASLPAATKILTPNSYIAVENLTPGSTVTSYDFINKASSKALVRDIKTHSTDVLIEITTEQGLFYATPHQLFYDAVQSKFIMAEALSTESVLVASNSNAIRCLATKTLQLTTPILSYDLALSQPHLFFSSDLQVLTHNYVQSLPAVVASLTELAKLGAAIACIYFAKTEKLLPTVKYRTRKQIDFTFKPEIITNIEAVKQKILRDANIFQTQGNALKKSLYDPTMDTITYCPADIMGIEPDITLYKDMLAHPTKFGPIYPLGIMTNTGDVECALYIFTFDGLQQNRTPRYVWKLVGSNIFRRNDPFVKAFIEDEDKKQIETLTDFIKKLPAQELALLKAEIAKENKALSSGMSLNSTSTNNDHHPSTPIFRKGEINPTSKLQFSTKIIYGLTFTGHSIQRMVERAIPPSIVADIINLGRKIAGGEGIKNERVIEIIKDLARPDTHKLYDKSNKIIVVVDHTWSRVITVRYHG